MANTRGRRTTMARAGALVFCALLAACSGGGGGNNGGSTCAVSVSIEPGAPTVVTNTKQPFVATVTGDVNTAVTWSVQEAGGGTVSSTGVYTAPATPGTYHVIATSQADPCATAAVPVTVEQAPLITVTITSPLSPVTVEVQRNLTFLASVTGTTNTAVTWSVQEGPAGGTINPNTGRYNAPTTVGVFHVVATSVADPSVSVQVDVNVVASTTANISPTEVTVGLGGQVQFSLSKLVGGTWSLNGDASIGTIALGTGLYTAPFQMPTPTSAIRVSQENAADPATVTLASRFLAPETLQVDGCVPQCPADQPNAIVAADFNSDGLDDLATANSGTGMISLLLAADKSHFDVPYRYPVGDPDTSEPQALAVADIFFDGNQRLDLAIADARLNEPAVRTLLGAGDGTFGAELPTSLPSDRTPLSITVAPLESNPFLDTAVANFQNSTIDILQGVGDGSFRLINTLTQADGVSGPISITSADFNGDNAYDLAVANSTDGTVAIFLSNNDGTFELRSIEPVPGSSPTAVAVIMMTGDNDPDLVVTTFFDDGVTTASDLTILTNTGDPDPFAAVRFMVADTIATGFKPIALATGDFNNDAVPDVVVVNEGDELVADDDIVTTYFFDPAQDTLVPSETYSVGELPKALAVGDFNGDGFDDVAVANSLDDTVSVLRNRGGPTAP